MCEVETLKLQMVFGIIYRNHTYIIKIKSLKYS